MNRNISSQNVLFLRATLVVTKILFWNADYLSLLRILMVEGHLFRFKFYLECKSTQRSGGWISTQEDMWNPVSLFIHFSLATGFPSKSSFILSSAPITEETRAFKASSKWQRHRDVSPDLCMTVTLYYNGFFCCLALSPVTSESFRQGLCLPT